MSAAPGSAMSSLLALKARDADLFPRAASMAPWPDTSLLADAGCVLPCPNAVVDEGCPKLACDNPASASGGGLEVDALHARIQKSLEVFRDEIVQRLEGLILDHVSKPSSGKIRRPALQRQGTARSRLQARTKTTDFARGITPDSNATSITPRTPTNYGAVVITAPSDSEKVLPQSVTNPAPDDIQEMGDLARTPAGSVLPPPRPVEDVTPPMPPRPPRPCPLDEVCPPDVPEDGLVTFGEAPAIKTGNSDGCSTPDEMEPKKGRTSNGSDGQSSLKSMVTLNALLPAQNMYSFAATPSNAASNTLAVTIIGAMGLANADMMSKSDPYCICRLVGKTTSPSSSSSSFTTPVIQNSNNPVWNFHGYLEDYKPGDQIEVLVFDKDVSFDDPLGACRISNFPFFGEVPLTGAGSVSGASITVDARELRRNRRKNRVSTDGDEIDITRLIQRSRTSAGLHSARRALRVPIMRMRETWETVAKLKWVRLNKFMQRGGYHFLRALLLLFDAGLVFWKTHYISTTLFDSKEPRLPFLGFLGGLGGEMGITIGVSVIFGLFSIDWLLRLLAGYHPHPLWEIFNMYALLTYALEISVLVNLQNFHTYTTFGTWVNFLCKFRILRFWQAVQVNPYVSQFQIVTELVMMMRSLRLTVKTTVSCFLMLYSFMLIFGVIFVDAAVDFCISTDPKSPECAAVSEHFGDVRQSSLSLFKAISGGDDWSAFYDILRPLPRFYPLLFLLFMFYSVFAFINVILGTMVEAILAAGKNDQQLMVKAEKANKQEFLLNMEKIFSAIDSDNNGTLTLAELQKHMEDVDVCAYFAALGVDANQVSHLFALLDDDDSGILTREEFLKGVLRLRGEAKSLDMAIILDEIDELAELVGEISHLTRINMAQRPSSGRRRRFGSDSSGEKPGGAGFEE